jgi:hypothetical protein
LDSEPQWDDDCLDVGYIRFSVPDDGNPSIGQNFELDAVSISHAALGGATVPEPTAIALFLCVSVMTVLNLRYRLR